MATAAGGHLAGYGGIDRLRDAVLRRYEQRRRLERVPAYHDRGHSNFVDGHRRRNVEAVNHDDNRIWFLIGTMERVQIPQRAERMSDEISRAVCGCRRHPYS